MSGAGGTSGGVGQFLLGLIMMTGGGYLLLSSIRVSTHFGLGSSLYHMSGWGGGPISITGGMVLIPFMIGIGFIFYNGKSVIGWLLASLSLSALIFGVIANIQFRMANMSAFELIVILVLCVGGLGLFLRSLRSV